MVSQNCNYMNVPMYGSEQLKCKFYYLAVSCVEGQDLNYSYKTRVVL